MCGTSTLLTEKNMLAKFKRLSGLTRTSLVTLGFVVSGIALTGCDLTRNQIKTDRAAHAEFQDFRDAMASRLPLAEQQAEEETDNIPSLQPYVAAPSENLKPMPLVSISVNQTVPLRDVLFELAKQAEYDVELDPRITGSIIFTAREKPFDMVVQLSYVRKSTGSIRNDISVVTGSGANTGSGFEAASESEANFWLEMTENLQQILGVTIAAGNLKTADDPHGN
jgi:general secretion pathway protein D